jgi:hypothetical protein
MRYFTTQNMGCAPLVLTVLLAGCGMGPSAGELAHGINEELKKEKICWNVQNSEGISFPMQVRINRFRNDDENDKIINGLFSDGYAEGSVKRGSFGVDKLTINLTAKGNDAKVWVPGKGFCIGHYGVDEIKQWTEPGQQAATVSTTVDFTLKLQDIPNWAQSPAFADIRGMTQPLDAVAVFIKTNQGWKLQGWHKK